MQKKLSLVLATCVLLGLSACSLFPDKEDETKNRISLEKQRSALTDLYQEKMRHLTVTRAGLQREWQNTDTKVRDAHKKADDELRLIEEQGSQRVKLIKDQKMKKVQSQIQGDAVRFSSPSRDELQTVQALLREQDYDVELQFGNYR